MDNRERPTVYNVRGDTLMTGNGGMETFGDPSG
jgi:hypothetical protein